MKKLLCTLLSVFSVALTVSCAPKKEKFKPALDVETKCNIKIAGDYDNFEAMEAEFDRFNAYYPNVSLDYVKLDDYQNSLGNNLDSADKPNIFFSYTWMIGNSKYDPVVKHMENLSDPKLKLNLDCVRPGLINKDKDGNIIYKYNV